MTGPSPGALARLQLEAAHLDALAGSQYRDGSREGVERKSLTCAGLSPTCRSSWMNLTGLPNWCRRSAFAKAVESRRNSGKNKQSL